MLLYKYGDKNKEKYNNKQEKTEKNAKKR